MLPKNNICHFAIFLLVRMMYDTMTIRVVSHRIIKKRMSFYKLE